MRSSNQFLKQESSSPPLHGDVSVYFLIKFMDLMKQIKWANDGGVYRFKIDSSPEEVLTLLLTLTIEQLDQILTTHPTESLLLMCHSRQFYRIFKKASADVRENVLFQKIRTPLIAEGVNLEHDHRGLSLLSHSLFHDDVQCVFTTIDVFALCTFFRKDINTTGGFYNSFTNSSVEVYPRIPKEQKNSFISLIDQIYKFIDHPKISIRSTPEKLIDFLYEHANKLPKYSLRQKFKKNTQFEDPIDGVKFLYEERDAYLFDEDYVENRKEERRQHQIMQLDAWRNYLDRVLSVAMNLKHKDQLLALRARVEYLGPEEINIKNACRIWTSISSPEILRPFDNLLISEFLLYKPAYFPALTPEQRRQKAFEHGYFAATYPTINTEEIKTVTQALDFIETHLNVLQVRKPKGHYNVPFYLVIEYREPIDFVRQMAISEKMLRLLLADLNEYVVRSYPAKFFERKGKPNSLELVVRELLYLQGEKTKEDLDVALQRINDFLSQSTSAPACGILHKIIFVIDKISSYLHMKEHLLNPQPNIVSL